VSFRLVAMSRSSFLSKSSLYFLCCHCRCCYCFSPLVHLLLLQHSRCRVSEFCSFVLASTQPGSRPVDRQGVPPNCPALLARTWRNPFSLGLYWRVDQRGCHQAPPSLLPSVVAAAAEEEGLRHPAAEEAPEAGECWQ